MRKLSKACRIAAILLLACLPVAAQITFSGQIAVNTIATSVDLANPVHYDTTVTSIDVRTPGALACTGYPDVGVWLHRGDRDTIISEVVLTVGASHWSGWFAPGTTIEAGDRVYALLDLAGVACTNELPITVSFTTSPYTANLSANLMDLANGASAANAFLRMTLQNCGTNNPQILGTSVVLAYQKDFHTDNSGHVSGTIYGNDKMTCGNTLNSVYKVTYFVNQIQVGVPKLYHICTTWPGANCSNPDSTFDPSVAIAIDPLSPPAISPFGYIYAQSSGNQSLVSPAPYALNIHGTFNADSITPKSYTIAAGANTLPVTLGIGSIAAVSDGLIAGDCTAGGGTSESICYWTGLLWTGMASGATMVYPPAGVPKSTGGAWSGSYGFSTDGTLGTSDTMISSQKAVKTYVDAHRTTINVETFTNSDYGDKINAAAASCAGTNGCTVFVPEGTHTFANTAVLGFGVSMECAGAQTTALQYTGAGTAVDMSGRGASIAHCGFDFLPGTVTGIDMRQYRQTLDDVYINNSNSAGGGTGSTWIHHHTLSNATTMTRVQMVNLTGTGILCEHGGSLSLSDMEFSMPKGPNGIALVVDTGCVDIKWERGNVEQGLHAIVIQNTMSDAAAHPPVHHTFTDLSLDCSSDDEVLLSSTLGNRDMKVYFTNSWVAGAGRDCGDSTTINAHKSGFRISGGKNYVISGTVIRANTGSGIFINNSTVSGVIITGNPILANNCNNNGTESGIDVTANVDGLVIANNIVPSSNNAIFSDEDGSQQYGVHVTVAGANQVIANNVFANNILGPVSTVSLPEDGNVTFGNTAKKAEGTGAATSYPDNTLGGAIGVTAGSVTRTWMIPSTATTGLGGLGVNCYWDGANWHFAVGGANGGSCWLADQAGNINVYNVPDSGSSDQTFNNTDLLGYRSLKIDNGGIANFYKGLQVNGGNVAAGDPGSTDYDVRFPYQAFPLGSPPAAGSASCGFDSTLGLTCEKPDGSLTSMGVGGSSVTTVGPATGAGTMTNLGTFGFANQTTTPALTIGLTNAGAHSFFGNNTGTSAAPSYHQLGLSDLATQATDTVVMNATAGTAAPTAVAFPACAADGAHAITYPSHVPTCTALSGGTATATGIQQVAGSPALTLGSIWLDTDYSSLGFVPGFVDNATSPNTLAYDVAFQQDSDTQSLYNIQYLPLQLAKIEKAVSASFAVLFFAGDSDTSGISITKSYLYDLTSQLQSSASGWGSAGPGFVSTGSPKNPMPTGVTEGTSGSWPLCSFTGGTVTNGHSGVCWGIDNQDVTGSTSGDWRAWTATLTDCFVYYAKQTSGGSVELYIDGVDTGVGASTAGTVGTVGSLACPTQTRASHVIKAQLSTSAAVTITGAILIDRTTNGVLVLKAAAGANSAVDFALNPAYAAGVAKINADLAGLTGFATGITLWSQEWGANEWDQSLTPAAMVTAVNTLHTAMAAANNTADFLLATDNDDASTGTTNSLSNTMWQYDRALQQYAGLYRLPFLSLFRATYPARTSLCGTLHLASSSCQRMAANKWLDKIIGHRTNSTLVANTVNASSPGVGIAHFAGGTQTATSSPVVATDTDTSIAHTGTDINTSYQVTATHLTASLPTSQGGTGANLSATGGTTKVLVQDASHAISAQDLTAAYIPNYVPIYTTASTFTFTNGASGTAVDATIDTPGSDTWYKIDGVSVIQTVGSGSCTGTATLTAQRDYTSADNSVHVTGVNNELFITEGAATSVGISATMTVLINSAPTNSQMWNIALGNNLVHVKGGTAFHILLLIGGNTLAACSPYPAVIFRPVVHKLN